jgi:hypothetical protein
MLATCDEAVAKVRIVIERAIVRTANVARRAVSSEEDTNIREVGFNRRTNFLVGAIVIAVVGTAALMTLRFILWIR